MLIWCRVLPTGQRCCDAVVDKKVHDDNHLRMMVCVPIFNGNLFKNIIIFHKASLQTSDCDHFCQRKLTRYNYIILLT